MVTDPTGDLLKEVGRLSQREFHQNIGWGRHVRGKNFALTKDNMFAGFAQAWAEGDGLWVEKLAIEVSFRRGGFCRTLLGMLARRATTATGMFRLASLRKSEAAWACLGFKTVGHDAEGLKVMQCSISVFVQGSAPQQEQLLTSSQQHQASASRADDLEQVLLQSQSRCEDLDQRGVALPRQCENLEHVLAQSRRDVEAAQPRTNSLEHMLLYSRRRWEELGQRSVAMAQQCENLEHVLAQFGRDAEAAQSRANDREHVLLQSQSGRALTAVQSAAAQLNTRLFFESPALAKAFSVGRSPHRD